MTCYRSVLGNYELVYKDDARNISKGAEARGRPPGTSKGPSSKGLSPGRNLRVKEVNPGLGEDAGRAHRGLRENEEASLMARGPRALTARSSPPRAGRSAGQSAQEPRPEH